ncbi:unnamed protein product [Cladocopium goreaui]|uniref:Uncharacterized protein n=1 Tax=Cladocopium goreaui TaxID=2562237 RepID=A0A9P1DA40_9DINO|nr:unnamed protein product [Cladocopium goreaui]
MRLLSKLALVSFGGFCHGVDVGANQPLVRREAGKSETTETETPRLSASYKPAASVVESNAKVIESKQQGTGQILESADGNHGNSAGKEDTSGIYGEAMDDGLSRFLVSSQALSEQNLESLQIANWDNETRSIELGTKPPIASPETAEGKLQARVNKLEEQLTNALEVARVAEAAASNATAMVAKQGAQLRAADERIQDLEQKESADEKDLGRMAGALADAKNRSNMTEAELAGIELKEFELGTRQDNVNRVVKDIEGKVVEFGGAAVHAERAAEEAESDAVKARNSSDLLKARQANMKYEVDDLHASLEEVFKEQNITRKAEQLLLLKALGLGKTITQIDGSMKLVNGSLGSVIRQALKSLKLAKEAKEEADDALDDVETAGSAGPAGFSGGYSRVVTASASSPTRSEAAQSTQTQGSSSSSSSSGSSQPVVVSSSYDVEYAAVAAKQHAKAAWEAVKQMQAQNGKSRPVYEVASMTGDLIQIMKGPQGPQGAPGTAGADGARGKRGPPGVEADLLDNLTDEMNSTEMDSTEMNSTNGTSTSRSIVHVPHSAPKGASIPLYFGALAANLIVLWLLYKSVDVILATGDLSARPWKKAA